MYFNDKYDAYCDINPHYQSKTVQIKTKGSYIHATASEARVLALALVASADELDRISSIDLGLCGGCSGELRAVSPDYAVCLGCRDDSICITDKTKFEKSK